MAGTALQWFTSYLTGHSQSVSINGVKSQATALSYGVPQGSVLGPFLYTIYTLPLGDILRQNGMSYHLYADDTQLYMAFDVHNELSLSNTVCQLQQCVGIVKSWMMHNKLKLNDDKTELLFIASPHFSKTLKLLNFI